MLAGTLGGSVTLISLGKFKQVTKLSDLELRLVSILSTREPTMELWNFKKEHSESQVWARVSGPSI